MHSIEISRDFNAVQYKYKILTLLAKLDDKDAQQVAADELKRHIDELTAESCSVYVSCLFESHRKFLTISAKKELLRLFAILCSIHGDEIYSYLPKMIAIISKAIKEGDQNSREVCADSLAIISKSVPTAADPNTGVPLMIYLKPLFELLDDQTKPAQMGAAACIAKILSTNLQLIPSILPLVLPKLLKCLTNTSLISLNLLAAVQTCIHGSTEDIVVFMPQLIQVLVECLKSKDSKARQIASDTLTVLVRKMGAAMSSYKEEMIQLLTLIRHDKAKSTRESVARAAQELSALKDTYSPTKLSIINNAEGVNKSTRIAHSQLSNEMKSTPLKSPAKPHPHNQTNHKLSLPSSVSIPASTLTTNDQSTSQLLVIRGSLEELFQRQERMEQTFVEFSKRIIMRLDKLEGDIQKVQEQNNMKNTNQELDKNSTRSIDSHSVNIAARNKDIEYSVSSERRLQDHNPHDNIHNSDHNSHENLDVVPPQDNNGGFQAVEILSTAAKQHQSNGNGVAKLPIEIGASENIEEDEEGKEGEDFY